MSQNLGRLLSMCNPVRHTQPAQRLLYDWNECDSSYPQNACYSVEHRLADGERRRERRVCFTQRAREGKFVFFHNHWIAAQWEEKSSTWDTEVNLEAGDALRGDKWTWRREVGWEERCGLGGDVDSEERSALGRHRSDGHLMRLHLEGIGRAHGGHDCEKRARKIQRSCRLDRHQWYSWCWAPSRETGTTVRVRKSQDCEHCLKKPE
jgi:hypothetical protein